MSLIRVKLTLILYAAVSRAEIIANCNDDVSLPCTGAAITNFFSLTWYKFSKGKKEGIVMKRWDQQEPTLYSSDPPTAVGEDFSLTLLRVTPKSSGAYECAINAKIGGRNLNPRAEVVVNDCVTQAATAWTTNQTETQHWEEAAVLPLLWSLVGWGVFSFAKVLFCLLTIQVLRCVYHHRGIY